jgi:hypothetical protein
VQPTRETLAELDWARELGLSTDEILVLNPCVPGEFTAMDTYYFNSATPRIVYAGSNEGTLPLVPGRWYLIPDDVLDRHADLKRAAVPAARAVRLTR